MLMDLYLQGSVASWFIYCQRKWCGNLISDRKCVNLVYSIENSSIVCNSHFGKKRNSECTVLSDAVIFAQSLSNFDKSPFMFKSQGCLLLWLHECKKYNKLLSNSLFYSTNSFTLQCIIFAFWCVSKWRNVLHYFSIQDGQPRRIWKRNAHKLLL